MPYFKKISLIQEPPALLWELRNQAEPGESDNDLLAYRQRGCREELD